MQLYKVLFLGFSVLLGTVASAQTGDEQRQNLKNAPVRYESGGYRLVSTESYKLTKDELITRYAFNDTARAVINLYFERRTLGRVLIGLAGGLLPPARFAGQEQQVAGQDASGTSYRPWVYVAAGMSMATLVTGLGHYAAFDRKSLVEKLIEYEVSSKLEKRIRRKLRTRHFKA